MPTTPPLNPVSPIPGATGSIATPPTVPLVPRRRRDDTAPAASPIEPGSKPPKSCDSVRIWGIPFDRVTLSESVDRIAQLVQARVPSYVITANLNYAMLHGNQTALQSVTSEADLIVADGQPIVWRSLLGERPLPQRVAGSEMIHSIAAKAATNSWKIYLLGGEPGVAQTCADRLTEMHPELKIVGVESPPFRKLSDEEQRQQDQRIQAADPDILLVALGQPKGEQWIHENYRRLGVPVSIQLGASFDFVAGVAKRAPRIYGKLGLEWCHRMFCDPRRLVPRYAANAGFLFKSLLQDWRGQVTAWGLWESRRRRAGA